LTDPSKNPEGGLRSFTWGNDMQRNSRDVGKRLLRLLKNILILYFALTLCKALEPYLAPILNLELGSLLISSELVFTGVSLVLLIYFGYFILLDIRFFLNLASKAISSWLIGEEVSRVRVIAYDVAVIIALILFRELATPLLRCIEGVGAPLATAVQIIVLAIILLMVYHLAGQLYHLLKDRIEGIVKSIADRFSRKSPRGEGGET